MLISIVVPVYNAESNLRRCLDSIKNQSYRHLQVILVNDGSIDNSGIICEEYAKNDERFTVIHKENGGVSSARNVGLHRAKGSYIGFVDADDYIESEMIYNLISLNKGNNDNADILMCGCNKQLSKDSTKKRHISKKYIKKMNTKEALNNILDNNEFHGYVCNKLFSSNVLNNYQKTTFDESIFVCEDLLFCCQTFIKANFLIYDNQKYYNYVFHGNNTTSRFNVKKLTMINAYKKILKLLKDIKGVNIQEFKISYFYVILSLLMQSIESNDHAKTNDKLLEEVNRLDNSFLTNSKDKMLYFLAKINPRIIYCGWKLRRNIQR